MALTPEQLHNVGVAVRNVEAAIASEPEAFTYREDRAHVVGEVVVSALAMHGLVIVSDPVEAAIIRDEVEREIREAEAELKLLS